MEMIKKILLYISAFIPLYFLLVVKIAISICTNNLSLNGLNTFLISFLSVLSGLGVLGLFLCMNKNNMQEITILSATNLTEKHFLGYFSLFVLFALSYEIEYFSMAVVFVLILIFVGIVYIKNNLFYINPLLNILGFSFYEVEYKLKNSEQTHSKTMFYFGKLKPKEDYETKLSDYNFNFIQKK